MQDQSTFTDENNLPKKCFKAPLRVRSFECHVKGTDWNRIINHTTAGKARYYYWLDVRECREDVKITDITVRLHGAPHTSDRLRRTAKYRNVAVEAGTQVSVKGHGIGAVLDSDWSMNFEVLFANGNISHVHAMEMEIVTAESPNTEVLHVAI